MATHSEGNSKAADEAVRAASQDAEQSARVVAVSELILGTVDGVPSRMGLRVSTARQELLLAKEECQGEQWDRCPFR